MIKFLVDRISRSPIFRIVIVAHFATVATIAQPPSALINESQKKTNDMFALFKKGDFESAIKTGEEVVRLESRSNDTDKSNLATATLNLAKLKRAYYEMAVEKNGEKGISRERRFEVVSEFPKAIEDLYNRAIELSLKGSSRRAGLQLELGEFIIWLDRYSASRTERFVRARKLYSEALASLANFGKDSEPYLAGLLATANFYQQYAEFEASLPLYLEFISTIEVRQDSSIPLLSAPLTEVAQILAVIGEDARSKTFLERARRIPNAQVPLNLALFDLSRRGSVDLIESLMKDPDTITGYTKKLKTIYVEVVIDESGKVINAKSEPNSETDIFGKAVGPKAEKIARSLRFEPLKLDGKPRTMTGRILVPYLVRA